MNQKKKEVAMIGDKNKFDHITKIIGAFGPYHAMIYSVIGLSIIIHGWQMFSNKFYTYKTDFWCAKPKSLANLSKTDWLNLSAPLEYIPNTEEISQCTMFNVTYSNITRRPDESTETIPCSMWEYDTNKFDVSNFTYIHCKYFL